MVDYGTGGPEPDLIATGDGGNPFTESGWTGWFDLDNGYAVGTDDVLLAPCGQTGVLSLRVGRATTEPPAELCRPRATSPSWTPAGSANGTHDHDEQRGQPRRVVARARTVRSSS